MDEQTIKKRARRFRHIGYAIFGGAVLYMIVTMLISLLTQIPENNCSDPFTGMNVKGLAQHCNSFRQQHPSDTKDPVIDNMNGRMYDVICRGIPEDAAKDTPPAI